MSARSGQRRTVRLVHFADYHAHAVPFYAEGEPGTAGVARLIAYLREARPGAVVTNGGDMLNSGSPAWSDRYQGQEWSWFNGLVDVMALGNHDTDYGPEVFARCRASLDHPILCANLVGAADRPVLTHRQRPYLVHEVDGIRLGLLAAAGPDIDGLVSEAMRPIPGSRLLDRTAVVERLVAQMRSEERVDAVVLVGHALHEDDVALARQVPGIDVVLGTHSHRRQDLTTIAGSEAVTVSPFQYGTYVADLRLQFRGGALVEVDGGLVRMSADRPEAPDIAASVAHLQTELAQDPDYEYLFEEIGHATATISQEGQDDGESQLGNLVADVIREACDSDVSLVGASAIREPIAPGTVRVGDVLSALPYPNQIYVYRLSGHRLQELLDVSVGHRGTNFHAQVAGVSFTATSQGAAGVMVDRAGSPQRRSLDPSQEYDVAINDFTADTVPRYREILAAEPRRSAGIELRETVMAAIRRAGHVAGRLDGRIAQEDVAAVARGPLDRAAP